MMLRRLASRSNAHTLMRTNTFMTPSGFMVMAQQPQSINIMNMPIRTFATKMNKEE